MPNRWLAVCFPLFSYQQAIIRPRRDAFFVPVGRSKSGSPDHGAKEDLRNLARLSEQHGGKSADNAPPPLLRAGQQVPWSDVCHIVQSSGRSCKTGATVRNVGHAQVLGCRSRLRPGTFG